MTSRILKIIAILALGSLLAGCKLAVIVPSGGDVTSASNTRNCSGGSLCEYNITDATFNDSFTAVAKPGYVFTKWNSGAGFLCGDSTNPTCTISNVGTAGIAAVEAIIATGQFFYALPLFEFVGIDTDGDGQKDHLDADDDNDGVLDVDDACPLEGPNLNGNGCPWNQITDTVTANNKVWAQVDLFNNLSWNDINAVCPEGLCMAGGVLNGYDMTGWKWAAVEDINALVTSYGDIQPPLDGFDYRSMIDSIWAYAFHLAGWRGVQQHPFAWQVQGWTSTAQSDGLDVVGTVGEIVDGPSGYIDLIDTVSGYSKDDAGSDRGAWFYK